MNHAVIQKINHTHYYYLGLDASKCSLGGMAYAAGSGTGPQLMCGATDVGQYSSQDITFPVHTNLQTSSPVHLYMCDRCCADTGQVCDTQQALSGLKIERLPL